MSHSTHPFKALAALAVLGLVLVIHADPMPGDVFREHRKEAVGDAGGAWRVGGSLDYGGGNIYFPGDVDLTNAIRAEVNIEKIQCHDGTVGLCVSVNDNAWIPVPMPESIPEPKDKYQHHIYPNVEVPLEHLVQGANCFKLKVDPTGWWPQNLIYGCHLRVYYDPETVDHPTGRITSPATNGTMGTSVDIQVETEGDVKQVDYLYYGKGLNYEGDGIYTQWHYHFFHANIVHHIRSASSFPFGVTWNTEWIPDQTEPMKLCARIVDNTELVYMTEAVTGLTFDRGDFSVELCEPYNVPALWVTRKGTKGNDFDVSGNPATAIRGKACWAAWASCYCSDVKINGTSIGCGGECGNYRYTTQEPEFDPGCLQEGKNRLEIPGTSGSHHGMEVEWPGVMVLVQYGEKPEPVYGRLAVSPATPSANLAVSVKGVAVRIRVNIKGGYTIRIVRSNGRTAFRREGSGKSDLMVRKDLFVPGMYLVELAVRDGSRHVQGVVLH
ncbi:MAG: hypothetical protein GF418_08475 [Chitinivibrionales bacterium]|nr:hypothetical protein [Chitinivibrionales bacterium]MBD3395648.1 hypothetical protein [Chitinivibrionales bacterium]